MTLILNQADWDELHQQAPKPKPDNLVLDDWDYLRSIPECIGHGYDCGVELSSGVWLHFYDCEYHQDLMVKAPVHEHPI